MLLRAFCETSNVLQMFYFINMLVKILCYVVPAILILMLTIDVFKNVMSGDEGYIKKNMKVFIKRIIFAALIFFIPMIVNIAFGLLGSMNVSAAKCYNNANLSTIQSLKEKETRNYETKKEEENKAKENQIEEDRAKQKEYYESIGSNSNYVPSTGKIGEAATGNNGTRNGKGDNTGKEVRISNWYYSKNKSSYQHWDVVIRFKDPAKANKAADVMTAACKNDYVGYDNRTKQKSLSFFNEAKKVNWQVEKINNACFTACSQLVLACVYATGIEVNTYKNAAGAYHELNSEKYRDNFIFYTDTSYTSTYEKLMRGDIIISYKTGRHHAAMVL